MLRNFFKNKKLLIIIGAVLAAVILVCVLIGALGESDKKDTTDHTSDKDNLISVLNENNTPEKDAAQTATQEVTDLLSWADTFDEANAETKHMIIARLVERIEINHDYEVQIKFRISVEEYMRIAA